MTPNPLLPDLTARAEAAAHSRRSACPCGATVTLADRPDATVVRHAGTVAKAHAPGSTLTELAPASPPPPICPVCSSPRSAPNPSTCMAGW